MHRKWPFGIGILGKGARPNLPQSTAVQPQTRCKKNAQCGTEKPGRRRAAIISSYERRRQTYDPAKKSRHPVPLSTLNSEDTYFVYRWWVKFTASSSVRTLAIGS